KAVLEARWWATRLDKGDAWWRWVGSWGYSTVVLGLFTEGTNTGGCHRVWRVAMEKRKRWRAVKRVVHDQIRKSMSEGKSRTYGKKLNSDKPRVVNNSLHVSCMYWLHYGSHQGRI
ncbi:hypothetical protein PIB30_086457, partial [Stylosanthes scabra]|nr:hypothetical protein [Stylosanthes scabra]